MHSSSSLDVLIQSPASKYWLLTKAFLLSILLNSFILLFLHKLLNLLFSQSLSAVFQSAAIFMVRVTENTKLTLWVFFHQMILLTCSFSNTIKQMYLVHILLSVSTSFLQNIWLVLPIAPSIYVKHADCVSKYDT